MYEASEFWDEHDFSEFADVEEVKDVRFAFMKKKYVGVDATLYSRIRRKAKTLHTTEDTLINKWLQEKVGV